MKRASAIPLQGITVIIGITLLVLMLWEPHLEGRNVNATPFEIYFKDPFLAYAYLGSIPFFVALYKAFTLFGNAGRNQFFTANSLQALRTIKYCMLGTAGLVVGGIAYIIISNGGQDDVAGGVAMGLMATLVSLIAAGTAALFERRVNKAV